MFLQPREIRFSQWSIGASFRNTKRLGETLDELITEKVMLREIPQLHVSIVDGMIFSMDNRRLWVFKRLEELGECSSIPVKITPVKWSKMDTVTEGEYIHIRGTPGGWVWKNIRAPYKPSLDTITEEVECMPVYSYEEQAECRSPRSYCTYSEATGTTHSYMPDIETITRRKCRARRGLFERHRSSNAPFVRRSCDADEQRHREPRKRKREESDSERSYKHERSSKRLRDQ